MTVPAVSPDIVNAALDRGIPVLVGTSGWTAERIATLQRRVGADGQPGVIIVPNFSLGSALATAFAVLAAPWFEFIEIVESHHEGKVDSPSGTAIRTAELIGLARTDAGPVAAPHADQRARGQQVASVPIHSLRHPGLSARQEVVFGGAGETIRVTHDTHADASYEAGILLGLRAVRDARGVVVGLDKLLDLGLGRLESVRVRIAVAVMAALLALYLAFAIRYGLLLIGVGEPIGIALGVALLVFPVIAAGALVAELLFTVRADRLGQRLEAEGGLPDEQLAQRPSGRIDRAAADAVFPKYRQDAEEHPDDWRAWYRLGLAYDASGDRRRARWATRQAITLSR